VAVRLAIKSNTLDHPDVIALLGQHMDLMQASSPPKSIHALELGNLRAPEISFWSAWYQDNLVGCGALREIDPAHGEIKSMHTQKSARGQGVGSTLLRHIVTVALTRNYDRLSLETGSQNIFSSARALYSQNGFSECDPFGDYTDDPNSIFMTRDLQGDSHAP
jgi:putative acetyltransferase